MAAEGEATGSLMAVTAAMTAPMNTIKDFMVDCKRRGAGRGAARDMNIISLEIL
jgi:hypothetical protein